MIVQSVARAVSAAGRRIDHPGGSSARRRRGGRPAPPRGDVIASKAVRALPVARAWPVIAVFGCVCVLHGAAMALVFARGYAFMTSAAGLGLGLALTLALAAGCGAVLSRTKGLDRDAAGLRVDGRAAIELARATLLALGCVAALIAALSLAGLGALRGWRGLSPAAIALTVAASVVNAAFQQLGLQSLGLAARGPSERSLGPSALTLALFVATHAAVSRAPIYLLNVALFGALTIAMFFGPSRRSYAAPAGFHGGWNAALLLVGALPESDAVAAVRWHGRPSLWAGGARDVEGGLAYTLALVAVGASLALARRARPRQ
jgi:hypothetical protein